MTFADWQQLSPDAAARELHQRFHSRLSPAQQRAVIAQLPAEPELAARFAAAERHVPLGGVPYLLKDLYPVAGQPMFAGSTFLPEVRPPAVRDAVIVEKLGTAGAVFTGRTHLQEFAYGITGENPHYGDCAHPRFPDRFSGGSSSGSAAAVAGGIVPFAIGTDTGGSVRLPAAFCGLFGFRLAPRDAFISDAFPLAPSYDTAGWFTASARDMATANRALVGMGASRTDPHGCYVELPGLDPEVALACRQAAARFATPSPEVENECRAAFANSADTYNTVVADEAWAVHHTWADRFQARYDPAVWQRLNRVHGLTAAQRESARQSTDVIHRLWRECFQRQDFIVLPASPFAALTKAGCTLENRNRILALTSPASIGGCPVLTVPVALPSGLTTGLQVVVSRADSPAIGWVLEQFPQT